MIAYTIVLVLMDPMMEPNHHDEGYAGFEVPSATPDAERVEVEPPAQVQLALIKIK